MFSCEFCEIFNSTFFFRTPLVAFFLEHLWWHCIIMFNIMFLKKFSSILYTLLYEACICFKKFLVHRYDVNCVFFFQQRCYPANIFVFKVNWRNTRKMCEIRSKFTIKTQGLYHWFLFCEF